MLKEWCYMLKVELTENYAGVRISGDYNDLDLLYDSIFFFIKDEPNNIGEYTMQNHLYAFLYDVRHAYQGDREAILVDNNLQDDKREYLKMKKKDVTGYNMYYSFNYLLPDIFLDMILIKYFIRNIDKKANDIYNPHLNMVNYFYSLVLHSLDRFVTEIKFNKIKRGLLNSFIYDSLYIPLWFENISIDYIKMTKKRREKEFMHTLDLIYNYIDYEDYYEMKKVIEKYCKEDNCTIDNFHNEDYPEDIVW